MPDRPDARVPDARELCHEQLGSRFARALSTYDTRRRVQVLVDDFLSDEMVVGKAVLDVGCGLGFFSERLAARGARVTACDLGPGLVEQTIARVGCAGEVGDALELSRCMGGRQFDGVISSECIEHTPDPDLALRQMAAVLRPGGWLSVSTPNLLWQPVVRLASRLHLRPFDGFENFNTFRRLRRVLQSQGVEVVREQGLHLWPFQFPLHRLSTWCDRHAQAARALMINLCVLGRKSPAPCADTPQRRPAVSA